VTNGILIIGELTSGTPATGTLEALAAGQQLIASFPDEQVAVLLASESVGEAPLIAIAHGADIVYVIEDKALAGTPPDAVVAVAQAAVEQVKPRFVIGTKTLLSRDTLPRLAARLGTALAQDCTALSVDAQGRLIAVRPTYGGNAEATIACLSEPAVAALRSKIVEPLPSDSARAGKVIRLDVDLTTNVIRTRSIERVEREPEGVRLEDAKVIVSGGRGLGSREAFSHLDDLAKLLGGAVGASRAACDAGWVPSSYQVGLTGKTVTPDLYIAVGISGASQHMAGCSAARTIVGINKDAGANIFKESSFGVVGDWETVLPAFIEQLHELLD
jgi:electron transfer flavoprotein alpha subunit